MRVALIIDRETDRVARLEGEIQAALNLLDPRTDAVVMESGPAAPLVAHRAQRRGLTFEITRGLDPYYCDEIWVLSTRRHLAVRRGVAAARAKMPPR